MGLPAKLTEEEQALLDKYAYIKKKRKEQLQKQAATSADHPKVVSSAKKDVKEVHRAPSDAKELAKRKILSGELKIKKDSGQREFKRARSHVDKKPENDRIGRKLDESPSTDRRSNLEKQQATKPGGRGYQDSFVTAGLLRKDSSSDYPEREQNRPRYDKHKKKIFVSGYGLTENILQNSFTKFGTILNVHPELERGHGFVTFSTHEAAEKAIEEMHGDMVNGVTLKVCMAGRPNRGDFSERRSFEGRGDRDRYPMPRFPSQDAPTPPEKPPSHQEKKPTERKLVNYEDEFDDF